MSIKVYEVTSVDFEILKSFPPKLSITAKGKVLSSGWHSAKLVPKDSRNGIYEYYFVAEIPIDHPVPGDFEIEANLVIKYPKDLKKIIVYSQNNHKEVVIEKSISEEAINIVDQNRVSKGVSKIYSFDEAFKDAINKLPPDTDTTIDKITKIVVKEIGAEKGGFHGLDQLYILIAAN